MQRSIPILFIFLFTGSISWCIYRDIQIEKQYTGDLRNRVVGARLQKDGQLPYFYKWKKNDSVRYYDPQNFDSRKVANITATPFFHQLLYPLSNLPQRTISKIWLLIEYLLLSMMTVIGILLAKTQIQKRAVIIIAALFLYTNAWTGHIAAGQLYLTIPFLALLFYYFSRNRSQLIYAVMAGLCTAVMILIRPNTFVFFLPFIFIAKKYTRGYKVAFLISLLAVFLFAFGSDQKRIYWQNYKAAIAEQIRTHQGLNPSVQKNDPDPGLVVWEGWDMNQVAKNTSQFHYRYNREHGNFFVVVNNLLHIKMPAWSLAAGAMTFILVISFFFYKRYRPTSSFDHYYIAILAFCLYMATDIFSPVHRFQYNASQWFFPLLVIASAYHPAIKKILAGIIAGLLLNSINLSFMPMEQTLGEYLLFFSVLILLFTHKPRIPE